MGEVTAYNYSKFFWSDQHPYLVFFTRSGNTNGMFNPKHLNCDPDSVSLDHKTIYDVGYWEIFWRNLIAGVGRGLGNFFFSLLIIVIVMNIFFVYVWPLMSPLLSSFGNLSQIINDLQNLYQSNGLGRSAQ